MILSVSRRTDIPAFFSEWFVQRLKEGVVCVRNPMNHKWVSKIFLNPTTVEAIVFWTKNAHELTEHLPEIEQLGYKNYCFMYTITNYATDIEKKVPDKNRIIDNFIWLSKKIGKERMVWRYDPILVTNNYDVEFHKQSFKFLCKKLSAYCANVVVSFVDIYHKNKKYFREVTGIEQLAIIKSLYEIARENNIGIQLCCEECIDANFIKKAACISGELIENVIGAPVKSQKDKGQRAQCLCLESIDIGKYNTCKHGCTYCYAGGGNDSKNYDPKSLLLCDEIREGDMVKERVPAMVVDNQLAITGCF